MRTAAVVSVDGEPAEKGVQAGLFEEGQKLFRVLQQVEQLGASDASNGGGRGDSTHQIFGPNDLLHGLRFRQALALHLPEAPARHDDRAQNAPDDVPFSAEQVGLRQSSALKDVACVHHQMQHFPPQHKPHERLQSQIDGVGPLTHEDRRGLRVEMAQLGLASQLATKQGMGGQKGEGDKEAKTVDELQRGEVPTEQVQKCEVQVGVHGTKLRQSDQVAMHPAQGVNAVQLHRFDLVASHAVRRGGHPDVVGCVAHAKPIFFGVFKQHGQAGSDMGLVVRALGLEAQVPQGLVAFFAHRNRNHLFNSQGRGVGSFAVSKYM